MVGSQYGSKVNGQKSSVINPTPKPLIWPAGLDQGIEDMLRIWHGTA